MKLKYLSIFVALSVMPAFYACQSSSNGHSHEEHAHEEHSHAEHSEDEHSHEEHSHEEDGHEGEEHVDGEIVFSPEKAERFGVKTTKVALSDFNEVIKVSGQIMPAQGDEQTVIAHSSGSVKLYANAVVGTHVNSGASLGYVSAKNIVGGDANESARISYQAAKAELDRVTPLYKDKIVTEKEYIAAKENYEKAKIAYNSHNEAGSSVTATISGTITKLYVNDGEYVETGAPIAVVSKNEKLLLRGDLPERNANIMPLIKSATFKPSYVDKVFDITEMKGRRTSSNKAATATPGYIPVFFEFANDGSVIPGSYAEVYLIGASKPNSIVLPVVSITEEQGEYFVYEKIDDECYMKRIVTLGMNNGKEFEILSGVTVGEEIVTDGAIIIKMAANSGAVPGHTHEH